MRVYVDGCYDLMHFGHANALRQAHQMGDVLVVGVHSDAEITKNKGPPVMKEEERYAAVRGCKWADEVVEGAPYSITPEKLKEYKCDLVVHGDDITTDANGVDCYDEVRKLGLFKEFKRTQGISTTELVGRMLLMTRDHHLPEAASSSERINDFAAEAKRSPYTGVSQFLTTTNRILQFSNAREAKPGDRVVYVDGAFDLFHVGHIEFLRKAKEMGDYLLVGIHDDKTINRIKGRNYPLMNLNERVLSVLSCRYVDEVIIGAPYSVTKDVLEKVYKVSVVVHGGTEYHHDRDGADPYALPKQLGIFQPVTTEYSYLTTDVIIDRILTNRKLYEERNKKKEAKELALLEAESANASPKKVVENGTESKQPQSPVKKVVVNSANSSPGKRPIDKVIEAKDGRSSPQKSIRK